MIIVGMGRTSIPPRIMPILNRRGVLPEQKNNCTQS
jgi:hypothetical protein